MNNEPFTAVDFPRQHPQQDVADHEVLMSFNGDSDALLFREWWDEYGAVGFNRYVETQRRNQR